MQTFKHRHRVTYSDCTVGNHIYYGRYLDLLEAARGEFFRTVGCPFQALQDAGSIFPVMECRLRYFAASRYDDILCIETWITEARGARLGFEYSVTREDGVRILEGTTSHACTTQEDRPRRIPAELLAALAPYIAGAATSEVT
jgi:acyl-CoA thioester hydrolase